MVDPTHSVGAFSVLTHPPEHVVRNTVVNVLSAFLLYPAIVVVVSMRHGEGDGDGEGEGDGDGDGEGEGVGDGVGAEHEELIQDHVEHVDPVGPALVPTEHVLVPRHQPQEAAAVH